MIKRWENLDNKEQTRKLTKFFAKARFRMGNKEFNVKCVDSNYDGGIDLYNYLGDTFFIFQTKFLSKVKNISISDITHETDKIKNTLTGINTNKKADEFVQTLKNETKNKDKILQILWLTTGKVKESLIKETQSDLERWKKKNKWKMGIEFEVVDYYRLETVLYDVKHGYVPYTGNKKLKMTDGGVIRIKWEDTGVDSIICTIRINEIMKWFQSSDDIDQFLQKNVREFLGEKKINKEISKSYEKSPKWFWYKHNGIILFVDSIEVNESKNILYLKNPQVVNGGQTLKALFPTYFNKGLKYNPAKLLLRIYKLPYEQSKTYRKSIDIIKALNSQNPIKASDLKSTDSRQVRIEYLMEDLGTNYSYLRKRSQKNKASRNRISMTNLALRYYLCKKNTPHLGIKGKIDELFGEDNKYNYIFNETSIKSRLNDHHVIIEYITVWVIDQVITNDVTLKKKISEFKRYTKWYVLVDIYWKLKDWKENHFDKGRITWINFLNSYNFKKGISSYAKLAFERGFDILPEDVDAREYFSKKETTILFRKKSNIRKFNKYLNNAFSEFELEELDDDDW